MVESRSLFLIIVLLIIGIGLLFFMAPLIGLTSSGNEARPLPTITVLDHHGEVDSSSGTYIVRGTAKNTGTVPVVKVYIVVTTYDKDGAEFGSTYDALMNLNPGDEASFRVEARPYYQGVKVARYNIVPNLNYVPAL